MIDAKDFESKIYRLTSLRARIPGNMNLSDYGEPWNDPAWLAVLFAILACGTQFTYPAESNVIWSGRVFGKLLPSLLGLGQ